MLAESLSMFLCGTMLLLWMLIATFSRSDIAETRAQWAMFILAISTATCLMWLEVNDGTIWGSSYLPKPLALLCLGFAFMARLNIKGKNISQGMNPHQIMKQNRLSAEEE